MRDEILSYHAMCGREARSLQHGMNFHVRPGYSVLLMSMRKGAPYRDRWDAERDLLIYEGHDAQKTPGGVDPKRIDQPLTLPTGRPTPNGKFYAAAQAAVAGAPAERVRVYEKLRAGVWSDKGMFDLIDARIVRSHGRKVVEFLLTPTDDEREDQVSARRTLPHSRIIPTHVKVEVWQRDAGRCVLCGSTENLHYDHDLPFAKGGTSFTAANVRILCAKHNLAKSDRIE